MSYDRNGVWRNNIEHRPYDGNFLEDNLTLLGCLVVIGMIVFSCIGSIWIKDSITQMFAPKAFVAGSVWEGTVYHDDGNGETYQSYKPILYIDSMKGNQFGGRMHWPSYGDIDTITSIEGNVISNIPQEKWQIQFVETNFIQGSDRPLSVRYSAVVTQGVMNGTWCCGSDSKNGQFNFTRTS